ncbi:NUDIX domain-containing protein [Candidatus Microgenomates bacterium]|nr:NUDIX domain-containing protein [Candidatus Microgenomates bacterium]
MSKFGARKNWPHHVSAGGTVYQKSSGQVQYTLLYRGKRWYAEESWHLPKGTLEDNETLEQCALREVKEESGLQSRLIGYLGSLCWTRTKSKSTGRPVDKTVHYFLFEHVSGDGSKMDNEHDRLEWYTSESAQERLAKGPKGEDEIIRRADRFLQRFHKP